MLKVKYPKTLHFSWSPNLQNDDRMLPSDKVFEGKNIIVVEKLDGENTNFYSNDFHARSLDSQNHPSRNYVKSLWGGIKHLIPDDIRICGENCYAKHSIHYTKLTSYFYVFGVYQDIEGIDTCLSWKDTLEWCRKLNLEPVPILYEGIYNEKAIKSCQYGYSFFGGEQEGYVVRNADSFRYDDFQDNVAKYVRKGHVQTDEFWMNTWVPNKLK